MKSGLCNNFIDIPASIYRPIVLVPIPDTDTILYKNRIKAEIKPFYLSSGQNSGVAGIWFPFEYLDENSYYHKADKLENVFCSDMVSDHEIEFIKQDPLYEIYTEEIIVGQFNFTKHLLTDIIERFGKCKVYMKISHTLYDWNNNPITALLLKYLNIQKLSYSYELKYEGFITLCDLFSFIGSQNYSGEEIISEETCINRISLTEIAINQGLKTYLESENPEEEMKTIMDLNYEELQEIFYELYPLQCKNEEQKRSLFLYYSHKFMEILFPLLTNNFIQSNKLLLKSHQIKYIESERKSHENYCEQYLNLVDDLNNDLEVC